MFLDIQLSDGVSFDIFEENASFDFEIIFITAYNQYAINAIKLGALDYLLKPIEDVELEAAVQKYLSTPFQKTRLKEFVVYRTDQIEARYILSAVVMEKLYELKLKFSHPIMFSFYQNKIYLAVQLEHGLFAFNPCNLTSQRAIENIYREIGLAIQMVDDLNLHINLSTSPYK